MSDDNKKQSDDIGAILKEFRAAKENAVKREQIAPPKHYDKEKPLKDHSPKAPTDSGDKPLESKGEKTVRQNEKPKAPKDKKKKPATANFSTQGKKPKSIKQNEVKKADRKSESIESAIKDFQQEKADEKSPKSRGTSLKKELSKTETKHKKENKKKAQKVALISFFKSKKGHITLGILIAIITLAVAIPLTLAAISSGKNAYLNKYEKKYNIRFPNGMIEQYCDMYGTNPAMVGYMKVSDTGSVISGAISDSIYVDKSCDMENLAFNTVVYAQKGTLNLESLYSTASSFNASPKYIKFDTLYKEYKWRVVGAFYTNTLAEDDNGYIFPYNMVGQPTTKSISEFSSELSSRFLYNTGYTISRSDKLLTVSCDTDYHSNFKFVVVAVMSSSENSDIKATAAANPRMPQVIYDEQGIKSKFALAEDWYPTMESSDSDKTTRQSVNDYK